MSNKMIFKTLCGMSAACLMMLALPSCDKTWYPVPKQDGKTSSTVNPGEESDVWMSVNDDLDMTETKVIEQPSSTFMKGYWPDGKLIPVRKDSKWQLFWGEATDALTEAYSPYPEDHISSLTSDSKVWGKDFVRIDGFNDGGSWFIGIFPLDDAGHYVGFFHAESHWDNSGTAHKSIGVAYSDDYGATWRDPKPIITADAAKPETPAWTGLGDGCVIWDKTNSRYICYYQGKLSNGSNTICMAASSDKNGASGTWKKWDGTAFTLDAYNSATGLGGENVPIVNLAYNSGANPSVMWNTYLNKWVMVYGSWSKRIYISYSEDGLDWTRAEMIMGSGDSPAWYPNLISEDGDLEGGQVVRMYWSHNQNDLGVRELACCKLKFKK